MKIRKLLFNKETIILPKEIEIEWEKDCSNAEAMWKTIKALVKELEKYEKDKDF